MQTAPRRNTLQNQRETETRFASAARKSGLGLADDVAVVADSPLVDALLKACDGLVAVLNAERQVIALNHALLASLNVGDPSEAMGLRLGEALHCTHSHDHAGGCGCSDHCRTCGAAVAMVSCQKTGLPAEHDCIVSVQRDGKDVDLVFSVKASMLDLDSGSYLLVFLHDITMARCQAELARVFFHDVSNYVQALAGTCQLLAEEPTNDTYRLATRADRIATRIGQEIAVQKTLHIADEEDIPLRLESLGVDEVLDELCSLFANHTLTSDRLLICEPDHSDRSVHGDRLLLMRVLVNMVTNALEATPRGGEVRVWGDGTAEDVRFCVHNSSCIPDDITGRVFQRHFSTKGGSGRGLGAYAMKMLGERYMGGKVDFETSAEEGTVFHMTLPLLAKV